MSMLKNFVAEQNAKKGSSVASESESSKASLLSWVPQSVSIPIPQLFNKENEPTDSNWFSEAKKDPMCPALSKKQRLIGFAGCLVGGIFCFSLSSMYIPVLLLRARKFALLYSLGSLFLINSFSFLWGPWNHMKHLMTKERLPFTIAYFGSLFGTLYFSMGMKSSTLTIVAAVVQVIALLWVGGGGGYIPGGQTGLMFISRLFTSAVSKTVSK
uniref:Vesicle transport protein n=1 Tax=Ciona savignyi TaxID=51511 RepID=H2YN39_CIOSA